MDAAHPLIAQADALLATDALGRSQALEKLFRFLLACSIEGRSPKEVEIAEEVFGRTGANAAQDASIRVHIHRLRRKLEDYYAGPGAGEAVRLVIPRGGYRLAAEPVQAPSEPAEPAPPAPHRPSGRRYGLVAGLLALFAATGLAGWWIGRRPDATDAPIAAARDSALWSPIANNGRRLAIVVGDYYIFGERDERSDVSRLIREFNVNSAKDLDRLVAIEPDRGKNFVDLGLDYLPVGVANALRLVTPVLRRNAAGAIPTIVVPASQITPETVKYTNIVYLGYISALGALRDPMFSGSRYAIGGSYDEIIDRQTGESYMAGSHLDRNEANPAQDYALIASFPGVTGNRVIVIAGTRDAALMQAAEYATRPESLAEITARLNGRSSFEALLAVESLHNVGLRARLIAASPRRAETDWSGKRMQAFPDDFDGPP